MIGFRGASLDSLSAYTRFTETTKFGTPDDGKSINYHDCVASPRAAAALESMGLVALMNRDPRVRPTFGFQARPERGAISLFVIERHARERVPLQEIAALHGFQEQEWFPVPLTAFFISPKTAMTPGLASLEEITPPSPLRPSISLLAICVCAGGVFSYLSSEADTEDSARRLHNASCASFAIGGIFALLLSETGH